MSSKRRNKKKGIKRNIQVPSKKGKIKEPSLDRIDITYHRHPIFCFGHLVKGFQVRDCDQSSKIALVEKLAELSELNWNEIQLTGRHKAGTEKIDINSFNFQLPEFITPDVSHLIAIRFKGMAPIIGMRDKFIFHLVAIDPGMKAYDHGGS